MLVGLLVIGNYELDQAIANAKAITWRTRDPKDNPRGGPGIDGVENDIVNAGGKADTEITSLEDDVHLYPSFQKMTDAHAFDRWQRSSITNSCTCTNARTNMDSSC